MEKLLRVLLDVRDIKFRRDDDLVDRFSRQHTTISLLILSVLVGMRHYFSENIHCWCPEVCASNHEK